MFNNFKEALWFTVSNRIPRVTSSRVVAALAEVKHPWLAKPMLAAWQRWGGLDLSEATTTQFESIKACFTRAVRAEARPICHTATCVMPSDGIVGAQGVVQQGSALQIKGMPYSVADLVGDADLADRLWSHRYLTLRILPSMYHRLHAPVQGELRSLRWMAGDCWNVDPPALRRVQSLFCKNHRAVFELDVNGHTVVLVAVAAVWVGAVRVHALNRVLDVTLPGLQHVFQPPVPVALGQELGWFEHGSTVVLFVPPGLASLPQWPDGQGVKMGQTWV